MASITEAPNNLTLTVKAELCAYSHTSRHDCWAVANIKAPLYEPESRVPIDVVAVIDVSGSMAGEKLNLVKKTLLFVIGQRKSMVFMPRPLRMNLIRPYNFVKPRALFI